MLNYASLRAYIIMTQNHKINHMSNKQYHSQNSNPGPCHGCSGPHLIRDCHNSVCKICKLNLDNHVPYNYPSRKPPAKQQWLNSLYNDSPHRNWPNGNHDPALCPYLQVNQIIFQNY